MSAGSGLDTIVSSSAPTTDGGCDSTPFADSYGDGCDWYYSYSEYCGDYDTEDFHANEDCCACTSDYSGIETFDGECDSTDAVDSYGDGCDWYDDHPSGCGHYDTADFNAH